MQSLLRPCCLSYFSSLFACALWLGCYKLFRYAAACVLKIFALRVPSCDFLCFLSPHPIFHQDGLDWQRSRVGRRIRGRRGIPQGLRCRAGLFIRGLGIDFTQRGGES